MIPKVIHYCWFGKAKKSELISQCILTWKKHLPDFELKEWNEENSIIDCDFALKAFRKKQWAFVSDYIRLTVLYKYGGIYLDTDMFLVKPLHDLLQHSCFLGKQDERVVSAGIIGSVPGHPFIKRCIDEYKTKRFDEHRLVNLAIPELITRVYGSHLAVNTEVIIYSPEYFYPYSTYDHLVDKDFLKYITPNSYSVHLWNSSWFSKKEAAALCLQRKEYVKFFSLMFQYMLENPSFFVKIPGLILRHVKRSAIS